MNKQKNQTTFIRVEKNSNYSTIHNEFLRRSDLSWKAKGIMAYILHLPNDWNINLSEVEKHATEGKTAFNSGWKELQDAGYVKRQPVKDDKTHKILYWETVVRECVDNKSQSMENQSMENQSMENQSMESQSMENQSLDNRTLLSTNKLSTNKLSTNEPTTNNQGAVVDDPKKNALSFYEHAGFGMLSPYVIEELEHWINDLNDELVTEALKITVENAKSPNLNYAKAIMKSWADQQVKSLDDVKALNKQHTKSNEKEVPDEYANLF